MTHRMGSERELDQPSRFIAWCVRCNDRQEIHETDRKKALKIANRAGWHYAKEGWICPRCSKGG